MKFKANLMLACAAILSVSGCSTTNHVEKLVPAQAVVKQQTDKDNETRFINLYGEKPDYPLTCLKDCYAAQPEIVCDKPMESCQFQGKQAKPTLNSGFRVTWFGHASFKIETPDGQTVLFDPVTEQFDWPVDWAFKLSAGFFRNLPNGMNQETLSTPGAIMYSHIHYDHFNKSDIDALGNRPEYLTPLGFAEHFPDDGYKITEMAWYANKSIGDLNIHFVPAHHFSSRIWVPYLYEDDDKTLWGGWLLEHNGKKLFFAGDTGYSNHFKDIQARYGDIDVCLLPIASYHHEKHANWYRYVHTTPEDALVAAKELKCKVMIPWGYGNASWKMGDKTSHSALFRLLNMRQQMEQTPPLYILNEGERVAL